MHAATQGRVVRGAAHSGHRHCHGGGQGLKIAPLAVRARQRQQWAAQQDSSRLLVDPPTLSSLESSFEEEDPASQLVASLGRPGPAQLFDESHADADAWADPRLAAYAPLGALLASLRFAAWVAGIALDAPWFRDPAASAAFLKLLGVTVRWRGEQHIPAGRHVLVSNHVSVGDLLMLFGRRPRYAHLITSALPGAVFGTRNLPAMLLPANKDTYLALAARQEQQQQGGEQQQQQQQRRGLQQQHAAVQQHVEPQLQQHAPAQLQQQHAASSRQAAAAAPATAATSSSSSGDDGDRAAPGSAAASAAAAAAAAARGFAWPPEAADAPVHVFPEGGMTNGSGMLRFSRGFMLFAESLPVVPVALRLRTALPAVRSHTLASSFLANLWWFGFQPWSELEATVLPPMALAPGESKAAFVRRVQAAVAAELRVGVSDVTIQQKRGLAKAAAQQQQQRKRQQRK